MNTATTATTRPASNPSFERLMRVIGSKLRRAIELSAAPYIILGSGRLF